MHVNRTFDGTRVTVHVDVPDGWLERPETDHALELFGPVGDETLQLGATLEAHGFNVDAGGFAGAVQARCNAIAELEECQVIGERTSQVEGRQRFDCAFAYVDGEHSFLEVLTLLEGEDGLVVQLRVATLGTKGERIVQDLLSISAGAALTVDD